MQIFKELNLALYAPKKDKCNVCSFEVNQIDKETYDRHIVKKNRAREEKNNDKDNLNKDKAVKEIRHHVFTMDVQAVKISPCLYASALYYKTKLSCHNFTVYNLSTHDSTCYARTKPSPYNVFEVDHTFIKKYSEISTMVYLSIRPGLSAGDPTVTNFRCIWYKPDGKMFNKQDFDED